MAYNFPESPVWGTVYKDYTWDGEKWCCTVGGILLPDPTTYVTWDSQASLLVNLSGGALVVTNTGATATEQGSRVASTSGRTSGKRYFEVTLSAFASGTGTGIGIGNPLATYTALGSNGAGGVILLPSSGTIFANGSNTGSANIYGPGNVLGFAIDLDNRKFWVRNGPTGLWNANAVNSPTANVGGVTIPAGIMVPVCTFNATGNIWTANFGTTPFAGSLPSGYTIGWPYATPGPYTLDSPGGPAYPGDVVMTNGGLTATRMVISAGGYYVGTRSMRVKTSGKYYHEIIRGPHFAGEGDAVGLLSSIASFQTMANGNECCNFYQTFGPGNIYSNNAARGSIPGAPVLGDVIGCAVDLDARWVWFRKNGGNWNNNAAYNPATGAGGFPVGVGAFAPAIAITNVTTVGDANTVNFGVTPYANAAPAGFGNWT